MADKEKKNREEPEDKHNPLGDEAAEMLEDIHAREVQRANRPKDEPWQEPMEGVPGLNALSLDAEGEVESREMEEEKGEEET